MDQPKILVVDDEPANRFLLEGLLTANGYAPLFAISGDECFHILEESPPDLILLDIMMPRMSGLEVLVKIINSEEWKNIPVIMVSAKTTSQDIQEALNQGAIDYIKKPFDEMELLARVKVGLRLKENEDKLRDMIRLRNDFIKIISHDLRSPFTAIHGFARILQKADNLTAEQKQSLSYIIQSVEFSDDYFNKLLSWTLLDHGDIKLKKETFRLKELLDNTIMIFSHKAEVKNISMLNEVDASIEITADQTYFRQAVANLVSNAIKFTKNDGRIVTSAISSENGISLSISDNGVGMPESITPEKLFRDSIASTRRGTEGEKGTGIGLSICKKILDAHHFGFTFTGNPQGGTRFIITITE